jgi:hypothetical protein
VARIILLLASGPGQPGGDVLHRLELHMALTPQGVPDEAALAAGPWPARRTLPDGRCWLGDIIRTAEGWALRGHAAPPHAALEIKLLRPGEYITLWPADGEALVFRIVEVQPD